MPTLTLNNKKPIMLICHGLNLCPSKMMDLFDFYTTLGFECYNLTLPGHQKAESHIWSNFQLTYWTNYVQKIYEVYLDKSQKDGIKLYLCAYSIGALIFQDLFLRSPTLIQPNKIIYFAPAIHIKKFKNILNILQPLPGKMKIPSFNLKSYRVWDFTTLSVYLAYFELEKRVIDDKKNIFSKNSETLIIIDPKDELVSYSKLMQIQAHNLHFLTINKRLHLLRKNGNHHLIIDKFSLGEVLWKNITAKISHFLD